MTSIVLTNILHDEARHQVRVTIEIDSLAQDFLVDVSDPEGLSIVKSAGNPSLFDQDWITDPAVNSRSLLRAIGICKKGEQVLLPIQLL